VSDGAGAGADLPEPGALFLPDADDRTWMPTRLARGPWDAGACHGGAPAALIARELESVPAPVPARLARITVELLRPVPLVPLRVTTEVVRPGAKVGLLEATVSRADDGQVLVRARALRIRTTELDFDDHAEDAPPVPPDEVAPASPAEMSPSGGADDAAYHNVAVEHRWVSGRFGAPGPAWDWIRLRVPVVPGEVPSGWQRAMAAADFANGISAVVPWDGASLFINPDLTVHLWREPIGEWIGMESVTRTSGSGIGASDSAIWDVDGRIGRGAQSLLLDRI
jgi:hypothetical protein